MPEQPYEPAEDITISYTEAEDLSPRQRAQKLADDILEQPTTVAEAIELAKVYATLDLADSLTAVSENILELKQAKIGGNYPVSYPHAAAWGPRNEAAEYPRVGLTESNQEFWNPSVAIPKGLEKDAAEFLDDSSITEEDG